MIKAAFFDIDGTLLFRTTNNLIPESTKAALAELRKRGIKVCLCTGRPRFQLPPCIVDGWPGFENGFDVYVTMSGSFCYDEDGMYHEDVIPQEEIERFYDLIKDGHFSALAQYPDYIHTNFKSPALLKLEKQVNLCYEVTDDMSQILSEPPKQLSVFVPEQMDAWLQDYMSECIVTRWSPLFNDIVPASSSKPAGIKATCERYGFTPEECIAFGDGGNDATMLEYVGIGVAMGNAVAEAKDAADYITTDVDQDGIPNALRHFGLID